MSAGIFEGSQLKGADATPIELPSHVPTSNDGWGNTEIEPLVKKSSLAAWPTVADTKARPRQRICLPLGVEPSNIWDARYLNSMFKHSIFQMDGVGKSHSALGKGHNKSHWTIGRVFPMSHWLPNLGSTSGCAGEHYVWTVLCSGSCASPYIYLSLSDAVGQYLRSQDITTAWLDDVCMSNSLATRRQPDRPKEGSPQVGAPRTHDLLRLRLLHGLSKMLTGTHHRPDLPGRRLRYGTTQVLRARGQTSETRGNPTGRS